MGKEYNISRTGGQCSRCGKQLQAGDEFVTTVREYGEDFRREDFCAACWEDQPQGDDPDLLGLWRSRIPPPQEKRKLFVDNDLLVSFFERLEGAAEPVKINLRFVLALVLMRKKLLVYDKSETAADDGRDVWKMHFKGSGQTHEVIDPNMDEEKIAEVSRHLSEILETEL